MTTRYTPQEMEAVIGEVLRAYRIHRNIDQVTLAERAGISTRALRNLESGNGSSLHTFCRVMKALDRDGWLDIIAPVSSINPSMLTRQVKPKQRASKPRRQPSTPKGDTPGSSDVCNNKDPQAIQLTGA